MRNTVRIVLALFLVVMILANYNSVRALNLSIRFLNDDLEQRAELVLNQISADLTQEFPQLSQNGAKLRSFFESRMAEYSLVAIYIPKPRFSIGLPAEIQDPMAILNGRSSLRKDPYLIVCGNFRDGAETRLIVIVFEVRKILQIERTTKLISYSNFLLMSFAAILVFYFLESSFRPYRQLMQTAKAAPSDLRATESHNEADFLIDTFNGVISKLKQSEQELAKLHRTEKARADDVQQLNQDLIRSISSGLILLDQDCKIRVFNQAAETILNRSRDSVLNRPYQEVIGGISAAFSQDIDRCFADRQNINRAEIEVQTDNNGGTRYLGAGIMAVQDRQLNFAGVLCLFSDITEFRMLQHHMAEKEKFASLGEMAGGVAHEFRNSVATISGYVQMLETKVGQDQKDYLVPVQKELQSLQKVINDFLSFARPVYPEMQSIVLHDLLRDCVEEIRVSVPAGIEFTMGGTFPPIEGDESMLRQVFLNLIRNAAEAAEDSPKPGLIEVRSGLSGNGKMAVIDVIDNGAGIKPDDQRKIFTPFFTTKQKGVGLGLAIVQKLILHHNGSISVESSPKGTTFRVQLPLSPKV